jgi:hypothetical protein
MEHRQPNAFANERLDHKMKLAFARDIQNMWASLVEEPIPPHLQVFVDRLCRKVERRG